MEFTQETRKKLGYLLDGPSLMSQKRYRWRTRCSWHVNASTLNRFLLPKNNFPSTKKVLTRRHNRMPLQKKVVPQCGWVIRIWVHRLHPRGGWWAKSDVDASDQRFGSIFP